jgi:hypothetical protein
MTTFNRATLAKVLEILDSSHAGEALAAAKLASTMVREAGLSWDDVLAANIVPRSAPVRPVPVRSATAIANPRESSRRTSSSSWCC